MARWSPTTPVSHGPTLGDILAGGVEDYINRRDRDRELKRQHKREDAADAQREEARQYAISQRPLAEALGQRTARQEGVIPHEARYSLGDALEGGSLGIGSAGDSPLTRPPEPLAPQIPRLGTFDTKTGTFVRQLPPPTEHRDGVQHLTDGYDYDPSQDQGDPRNRGNLAEIQARHEAAMAELERRAQLAQDGQGAPPRRDPVQDHKDIRDYDIAHPIPSRATAQGPTGAKGAAVGKASLPNATEQKSAGLYRMAKSAYETVEKLEPSIVASQVGRVPLIGNTLMGMKNPEAQALRQASYQLADAWMRFVSGAAVPEPEVKRYMEMITPQPGDTEETTLQKRQTRAQIIAALEKAGGRAMDEGTRRLQTGSGSDVNPPQGPGGGSGDIDLRTNTSSGVSQDELARAQADLARIRAARRKP